jgi:hypothetical protein
VTKDKQPTVSNRRSIILDTDDDDPMLSAINLVDVFLVVVGVLLIAVIENPLRPSIDGNVTIIRDEGKPNMEIIVKDGQQVTKFQSVGGSIEGDGEMAGTAYRLRDGSLVYVPASRQQ